MLECEICLGIKYLQDCPSCNRVVCDECICECGIAYPEEEGEMEEWYHRLNSLAGSDD
jgi:hypothetical protein